MKRLIATTTAMVFALGLAAAATADTKVDKAKPVIPVEKVAKPEAAKEVKDQLAQTAAPQKEMAKPGDVAKPETGKAGEVKKEGMEKPPKELKGKVEKGMKKVGEEKTK